MSWGGGFGQPAQTGSGFGGGFGANNQANTGGGFGAPANQGFGAPANTGNSLFGGGSGGFGTGGGFAASANGNQTNAFGGAKPLAFGQTATTSAGGGFGAPASTTSTPFGGSAFGAQPNQSASTAFGGGGAGAAATGNSLFGAKPAFGSQTNTGTNIFGNGGVGGFGAPNPQNNTFGAPANPTFAPGNVPCEGSGVTPFQPFQEKDTASGQTNYYQSICMMAAYSKYSPEELRAADYASGRKNGNASNQPGAFGANTGYGGFQPNNNTTGFGSSNTNTGGFLNPNNNATAFGAQQTPNAFGAPATGGSSLFAPKPATPTPFGAPAAPTQPTNTLFGASPAGFGSTQNVGLNFNGGNTATNQGFGAAPNNAAFGSPAPGAFGATSATPNAFGAPQQQQSQPQQQQPANPSPFGSLFNNTAQDNQAKAGGLFGSTPNNNASGVFGATNQVNQTPSLFNTPASNAAAGGLFAQKPASEQGTNTTSTGLFGNTNNANNAGPGGGLSMFGQPQQNSLNQNNDNQQRPSLFGASTTNYNAFGSTFANAGRSTDQQNQTSFLGNGQNQAQPSAFGGSSFQQNPQAAPQPNMLSTSIYDIDPFGGAQLFNGLAVPNTANTGPIATPLSSSQKLKKSAIYPQYKINPSASVRLLTPQTRAYGFSYSTYGSPGSAAGSVGSPLGLNNSLLGGSVGRTLGKSLSTSNLRRTFDADESVLAAGAFSAGGNRYGSGSLKRLVINRNLRTDLFSSPQPAAALPAPEEHDSATRPPVAKKKVSFSAPSQTGGQTSGQTSGQTNGPTSEPASGPTLEQTDTSSSNRVNRTPNAARSNGTTGSGGRGAAATPPATGQVNGSELAVVHEDGTPPQQTQPATNGEPVARGSGDQVMGEYWMSPTEAELRRLPREQLKRVSGFTVGRKGCGFVEFKEPVDLTTVALDRIFDHIVIFITRSCTVYPDSSTKPEVGRGLNVPARISLGNSWPRFGAGRRPAYDTSGPKYEMHMYRLKKVPNTEFESFDAKKGIWVFSVQHFTTYGIDDDDVEDEYMMDGPLTELDESLPNPASSKTGPQPSAGLPSSPAATGDVTMTSDRISEFSGNADDTFDFMKSRALPGAFDEDDSGVDRDMAKTQEDDEMGQYSLAERSMASTSENDVAASHDVGSRARVANENQLIVVQDQDMAEAYPNQRRAMDPPQESVGNHGFRPRSILKISGRDTPGKMTVRLQGDWAEQLQRTMSPKKQDRQALREIQANEAVEMLADADASPRDTVDATSDDREFRTSIDVMNSLFGHQEGGTGAKVGRGRKAPVGFEV